MNCSNLSAKYSWLCKNAQSCNRLLSRPKRGPKLAALSFRSQFPFQIFYQFLTLRRLFFRVFRFIFSHRTYISLICHMYVTALAAVKSVHPDSSGVRVLLRCRILCASGKQEKFNQQPNPSTLFPQKEHNSKGISPSG